MSNFFHLFFLRLNRHHFDSREDRAFLPRHMRHGIDLDWISGNFWQVDHVDEAISVFTAGRQMAMLIKG